MMGLDFVGRVFEDNFLIADVVMDADFPTERWFWFDPPFNRGQSALLHKQPDGVWRIDLQLGWNIDKEEEKKPGKRHPAPEGDARRRRQVRTGMGIDLHLPVPAHGEVPPRPCHLRRRRCSPGLALWRARREFRPAGYRQSVLEAEAGDGRPRTRQPARKLRCRAYPRRRREHHELVPLHGLHHPEIGDQPHLPRRGAGPVRALRFRPSAGQFRPSVGALRL